MECLLRVGNTPSEGVQVPRVKMDGWMDYFPFPRKFAAAVCTESHINTEVLEYIIHPNVTT